MANYIKIFNDTVLKQSILQGYQAQRTNTNLGSFTMGELAFTRDTGRVFVGNFTNQHNTADSKEVKGGILVGNKYLGLIDSKPLGHFSPNNFPLKYGVKNISTQQNNGDGAGITVEEQGILLKGSIHRKDDNGGWGKDVEYIEKYDAYSGDYMFDIFNNALILFDKNITTDENIQPVYHGSLSSTNEQGFTNENGDFVDGTTVTRRTKIYDNSGERNKNYPIYGDGYVIMRILEPDGVTIGYKDRGFTELGIPKVDKDEKNNTWQNWSHNILELKHVPSTVLIGALSEDNFYNDGDFVRLNRWQKNVDGFLGTEITIPRSITFANFYNDETATDITIKPNGDVDVNNIENRTLSFNINTQNEAPSQTANDLVLSVNSNNVVSVKQPYRQEFNISLQDGLINPITGANSISLTLDNEVNNRLAIGFTSTLNIDNDQKGSNNPFYVNTKSQYYYSGNKAYNISGNLVLEERWDDDYKIVAKKEIEQFDNDGNVSYNMLKKPVPFCWVDNTQFVQNGSAKMEFLIKPYLFCINKEYNIPSTTTTNEETGETTTVTPTTEEFFGKSNAHTTVISVLGNNGKTHLNNKSDFFVVDGYTTSHDDESAFDGFTGDNTQILYHIQFGDIENYSGSPEWDWTSTLTQSKQNEYIYTESNVAEQSSSSIFEKYKSNIQDSRTKFKYYYPTAITTDGKNKEYDDYPTLFALMFNNEQGGFTPSNLSSGDGSLINLNAIVPKDTFIDKIEMSTNSSRQGERIITLCDFTDNTFINRIMSADNKDVINTNKIPLYIKKNDTQENIYINALTNSSYFVNETTTPYYIKLHTSDGLVRLIPFNSFVELDKIYISKYTMISKEEGSIDETPFYSFENNNPFDNQGFISSKLVGVTITDKTNSSPYCTHTSIEDYIASNAIQIGTEVEEKISEITYNDEGIPERVDVVYSVTRYEIPTSLGSQKAYTFITAQNKNKELDVKNVYKNKNGNLITKRVYGLDERGYEHVMRVTYNGKIFTSEHTGFDKYRLMTSGADSSFTIANDFNVSIRVRGVVQIVEDKTTGKISYKIGTVTECPVTSDKPKNYIVSEKDYKQGDDVSDEIDSIVNNEVIFWSSNAQSYNLMKEYKIIIPNTLVNVMEFERKTFIKKSVPTYKAGYVIPTDISWNNGNKVVIPDNASSIICDVHYLATGNAITTSLYCAKSKEYLSDETSVYNFPFSFSDGKPTQNTTRIGEYQKLLYSNSQSGAEVIEIPLTRFNLNKSKGFCLRLNNAPNITSGQLVIRIIGYRV